MVEILNSPKSVLNLMNKYSKFISRVEAEALLSHIFNCTREGLYINNYPVGEEIEKLYYSFIEMRLSGEPLQYIIGTSEFMGLEFVVNKHVFIPRPETEMLVNEVVQFTVNHRLSDVRLLDLCTGCGNIAVSLSRLIPCSEIIATDISEPALETAQKNSIVHGTEKNITLQEKKLL